MVPVPTPLACFGMQTEELVHEGVGLAEAVLVDAGEPDQAGLIDWL